MLVRTRKPKIPWDQFKQLTIKDSQKIFHEKKKSENNILIYIYFEIKTLILILIINSNSYI